MTTEERIVKLEKELADIRGAKDFAFVESVRKRIFKNIMEAGVTSASLADINETTVIGGAGGSVTHAEGYDQKVRVTIDGSDYYIGLYNV